MRNDGAVSQALGWRIRRRVPMIIAIGSSCRRSGLVSVYSKACHQMMGGDFWGRGGK